MRKPRVFLSHSKQDKSIIEKVAGDLRRARIDVWYDEWEIPPGESFRKKIFEDGIPNCDLFFIYLTEHSKDSFWVRQELDAAFIHQMDLNSAFLAIFVSSDAVRHLLSLDLRGLHSPVLNETDYNTSLISLISRSWEITAKNLVNEEANRKALQIVTLEKQIAELNNEILRLTSSNSNINFENIVQSLESKHYTINSTTHTLKTIFVRLSNLLAAGTNVSHFDYRTKLLFGVEPINRPLEVNISGYDILGELILKGLVQREPSNEADCYVITEAGRQLVMQLKE
ncbi:toll/interleukin-1 receptor domain-containing protein [Paenibacillus dendritiformis]|uniref:toll/interleukin-1 receptor domain-containing protein n=1 Tax=Paenibacillus dendritiformis TaxID=130049 RepID=UPI001059E027|nr:toll/interleukin-1 receptor domain-containing protein [Paenibacillus dendritiformis]TDL48504.1 toll/interleukin-1 receptor domain-containing protein [Paenibacillus dendritiformis]